MKLKIGKTYCISVIGYGDAFIGECTSSYIDTNGKERYTVSNEHAQYEYTEDYLEKKCNVMEG